MEHRWGNRVPLGLTVRVDAQPRALVFGRLRDASVSGAYVSAAVRLPLWTRVYVELDWPRWDRTERSRVPAYVVRGEPDGIALEWCEFAPPAIRALLGSSPTTESPVLEGVMGRPLPIGISHFPSRHVRDRVGAAT